MSERALTYVYCAADGRVTPKALRSVPPLPGGGRPRAIPLTSSLTLVVAEVPHAAYNQKTLAAKMSDLDWIALCAASHHAAADALARKHVVVPFRLFTLFADDEKAVSAIKKRKRALDRTMTRFKGRAEWVLRIRKPEAERVAPREVRKVASGADFLRAKAESRTEDMKRARRIREESLEVYSALSELADRAALRPVDPAVPVLLDAVFLLESKRVARFKKTLTRVAAGLLRDGCPVSLTGPWPPYSFVASGKAAQHA